MTWETWSSWDYERRGKVDHVIRKVDQRDLSCRSLYQAHGSQSLPNMTVIRRANQVRNANCSFCFYCFAILLVKYHK